MTEKDYLFNISFESKIEKQKNTYFLCCLDISDSMNLGSSEKSIDIEALEYSRWDLVKHSVTTIISSLNENDRLKIFLFIF